MVKSVVVTLTVTIPDTELGKDATVTVGTATYAGKVAAILTHDPSAVVPAPATVKITGPGLVVTP